MHVQSVNDPVVLSAVNDHREPGREPVEQIWQKIVIIDETDALAECCRCCRAGSVLRERDVITCNRLEHGHVAHRYIRTAWYRSGRVPNGVPAHR